MRKRSQYRNRNNRLRRWHRILAAGGILSFFVLLAASVYFYGQRKDAENTARERLLGENVVREGIGEENLVGEDIAEEDIVGEDAAGENFAEEDIAAENFPENFFQEKTVEYGGKRYRRSSNVKAILCIGVDREGKMEEKTPFTMGGQADGIYVIAQDTARNTLKFLIVPRDSMTEIILTDVSGNVLGKDIQHLNLAYAYGDGRELSCARVGEALSGMLYGFSFEHYVTADVDIINMVNQQVGGVTVTVPEGMEKTNPAFVEGARIRLEGEQAEAFVRYRDIEEEHSAVYRLDRQKEFMIHFQDALQEKAGENGNIIVEILEEIEDYMVTDMEKDEYLKLAIDAVGAEDLDEKDFYTLPGQSVVGEVYNEFYPDRKAIVPILLELFYREAA